MSTVIVGTRITWKLLRRSFMNVDRFLSERYTVELLAALRLHGADYPAVLDTKHRSSSRRTHPDDYKPPVGDI